MYAMCCKLGKDAHLIISGCKFLSSFHGATPYSTSTGSISIALCVCLTVCLSVTALVFSLVAGPSRIV